MHNNFNSIKNAIFNIGFVSSVFLKKPWADALQNKESASIIRVTYDYNMVYFLFSGEGIELQGNLGIVPERILCWDDYSHCMSGAGLCYQTSTACEAQGSEGRVRPRRNLEKLYRR